MIVGYKRFFDFWIILSFRLILYILLFYFHCDFETLYTIFMQRLSIKKLITRYLQFVNISPKIFHLYCCNLLQNYYSKFQSCIYVYINNKLWQDGTIKAIQ